MSLNLTGLADVAERSLQQIADDRRQTLDGAKHHAHVDVRLNELEESALSSLLMPMYARCRARPVCHLVAPPPSTPLQPHPTTPLQPPAASPHRRLPAHLLGTEERGARTAGDDESMEAADRPPSPSRLEEGDFLLCFGTSGPRLCSHVRHGACAHVPAGTGQPAPGAPRSVRTAARVPGAGVPYAPYMHRVVHRRPERPPSRGRGPRGRGGPERGGAVRPA